MSDFYPLSEEQVNYAKFSICYLSNLHENLFVKGYFGEVVKNAKSRSGYKWILSPIKNMDENSSFILNFMEGVALKEFKKLNPNDTPFNLGDFHVGFWVGAYVMLLDSKITPDSILRIFKRSQTNFLNCIFLNGNTVAVADEFLANTCKGYSITSHFILSQALDIFREVEEKKFAETVAFFFTENVFKGEVGWTANLKIKSAVSNLEFIMTLIEFGKEYRKISRSPNFNISEFTNRERCFIEKTDKKEENCLGDCNQTLSESANDNGKGVNSDSRKHSSPPEEKFHSCVERLNKNNNENVVENRKEDVPYPGTLVEKCDSLNNQPTRCKEEQHSDEREDGSPKFYGYTEKGSSNRDEHKDSIFAPLMVIILIAVLIGFGLKVYKEGRPTIYAKDNVATVNYSRSSTSEARASLCNGVSNQECVDILGTEIGSGKRKAEAQRELENMAEAGVPEASQLLMAMYYAGALGTEIDIEKAKYWYTVNYMATGGKELKEGLLLLDEGRIRDREKWNRVLSLLKVAVDKGCDDAIMALSKVLELGLPTVAQPNYVEARRWIKIAYEKKMDGADLLYARYLYYGVGGPRDVKQALEILNRVGVPAKKLPPFDKN